MLRGERTVLLRKEPERTRRRSSSSSAAGGTSTSKAAADLDPASLEVFERLRAWRAGAAREQGVPAYVVFHDATLRDIVLRNPASLEELGSIGGVGATKLERYGDGVLATLAS
ncbi:HRDC domain-containing protein [Cellulomonas sp.]|uniref:HRDC domain-containing protein n=1 Tax=Cellulomonas sp. TaxID=40001 RepID=UPI00338DD55B